MLPAVGAAIIVHLFLAVHNYCGVDGADFFSQYSQFAYGLRSARYVYFSASCAAVAIPHAVSCLAHIPLTVSAKIMQAAFWIACSYLLVEYFRPPRVRPARGWFLFLALNPVAIFAIHYHLQRDAMVLFLMIAGLAMYRAPSLFAKALAGMCWALAVSAKVYPALFLPLFLFDRRNGLRDTTLFYASCALFFLIPEIPWIYSIGWHGTFAPPLAYRSFTRFGLARVVEGLPAAGPGGRGLAWLFAAANQGAPAIALILVAAAALRVYRKDLSLFRAIGFCFAALFVLSPKNAPQYFIFLIPFCVAARSLRCMLFGNASYALILSLFYLLDMEMNGSYCLVKPLAGLSISRETLLFWEGLAPWISRYLWGYLFLLASVAFAYSFRPGEDKAPPERAWPRPPGRRARVLLCGVCASLWGISLFSTHFSWNPFSVHDDGLTDTLKCNRVLQPPSTLGWYGTTVEYEVRFNGLMPGDAVRVSGDSYFSVDLAGRRIGPFRGDGNKLYSFWWGVSYPLGYDDLRANDFTVRIVNQLCSIRGVNTITARLIQPWRDWRADGHHCEGKIGVTGCLLDGIGYGVDYGERRGWLDTEWLTLSPRGVPRQGGRVCNIFTIIVAYIVVFFTAAAVRLKVGGE